VRKPEVCRCGSRSCISHTQSLASPLWHIYTIRQCIRMRNDDPIATRAWFVRLVNCMLVSYFSLNTLSLSVTPAKGMKHYVRNPEVCRHYHAFLTPTRWHRTSCDHPISDNDHRITHRHGWIIEYTFVELTNTGTSLHLLAIRPSPLSAAPAAQTALFPSLAIPMPTCI